jgi:hypothetical protein
MPKGKDELPQYVVDFMAKVPAFPSMKSDNSTPYRYIFFGEHIEVRINQRYGIKVRRNPTSLMLRKAVRMTHDELAASINEALGVNNG